MRVESAFKGYKFTRDASIKHTLKWPLQDLQTDWGGQLGGHFKARADLPIRRQ